MSFAEGYLMGLQIKERQAQEAVRAREFQQQQALEQQRLGLQERDLTERQTEFKSQAQSQYEKQVLDALTPAFGPEGQPIMPTPELRTRLITAGKARGLDTSFLESAGPAGQQPGAPGGPQLYTLPSQDLSADPDVQSLIKTLPGDLQLRAQSTVKAYGGSKRAAMLELNRMGDEAEQAQRATTREQQQQQERQQFELQQETRRENFDRWKQSQSLDFKKSQALDKIADPYLDAVNRYTLMQEAVRNPNAQNDVSLLFNHMGMTMGAQKGARMTADQITEAIRARSVPQDALAALQRIGVAQYIPFLSTDPKKLPPGGFLTPQQRQQMLALGGDVLNAQKAKATERAKIIGIDFDSFVTAPAVEAPNGKAGAQQPSGGTRTGTVQDPATHHFSKSAWKKLHPRANDRQLKNAIEDAQEKRYQVTE